MLLRSYINKHIAAHNRKEQLDDAVISVKTSKGISYCKSLFVRGGKIIRNIYKPLCSGATVWVESEVDACTLDPQQIPDLHQRHYQLSYPNGMAYIWIDKQVCLKNRQNKTDEPVFTVYYEDIVLSAKNVQFTECFLLRQDFRDPFKGLHTVWMEAPIKTVMVEGEFIEKMGKNPVLLGRL